MVTLQRNAFKVGIFNRLIAFSQALAALPNKLVPAPFRLIQLGSAFWQSRALYVAAEIGVADVIADAAMSSEEISEKLNLHPDYLYRLLRMLASIGVFEECSARLFCNNKLSRHLQSDHPHSVRSMILLHNSAAMSRPWFEALGPALRDGEVPFVKCHGEQLFDYLDRNPELDRLFTRAMASVESITGIDYLEDFDWQPFERLIDVGGSNGSKTLSVLKKNPHLKALVFDRPQVTEKAAEFWQGKADPKLLERATFSGGDMLKMIPAAESDRDIYLLTAIFHGMGDAQCLQILHNLLSACGSHRPAVAVIDCVAEEKNIDPTVASFDMQMLVGTRGRERTLSEWTSLIEQGGFVLQEIVSLRTFARLLVLRVSGSL